jgi:glycerophosphoryl diester phosphodiesterase
MVENDIYLMRDGNIIVMHDGTIDRTTNGTGNTADQTAETIKNYVVDGNANAATTPVPTLRDYFEEFKGTGEVLVIELKGSNTKVCAPLAKLIKEYNMERQVVVIAFNKSMISAMRVANPNISINFLTSDITANEQRSLVVAQTVLSTVIPLNTAYSPNQGSGTLGINLYTDLAVRGVTLWNWTVNKEDAFNSFFISGIRGITTNYSQWAGTYVEDFTASFDENGKLVLNAVTYAGNNAGAAKAELVVIGGTGTYEDGHVTLSDDAEGYFFKLKKTLSNGTAYYVVTPVVLKADNVEAEPLPETTAEETTEAITYEQTEVEYPTDTEPVAEKGCGSMISLSVLALIPAAVLIIKKKED